MPAAFSFHQLHVRLRRASSRARGDPSPTGRTVRQVLATGTLFALCAWVAAALAHARFVRADPAPGAVLQTPPRIVRVVFNAELSAQGSTLAVWDARGHRVDDGRGGLDLQDLDRRTLTARLHPIGPGRYTVRWQARSAEDGHTTRGQYTFLVTR